MNSTPAGQLAGIKTTEASATDAGNLVSLKPLIEVSECSLTSAVPLFRCSAVPLFRCSAVPLSPVTAHSQFDLTVTQTGFADGLPVAGLCSFDACRASVAVTIGDDLCILNVRVNKP
jgi:hypothetical protein